MKKALKMVGRIFVGLLILVVALILLLPLYGPSTVSRILSSQMNTEVSLDRLSLSARGGRLALRGFRVAQPQGFGPGNLLELGSLDVEIKTSSLWNKPVRIERVSADGLHVFVVRNKEGLMNVEALAPPSEAPAEEKAPVPAKTAPEASKETLLVLESLTLEDSFIRYEDASLGDKPLDLVLTNVQVRVEHVQVGGAGDPARVEVRLELVQPEQDAQLLVLARVGPVGAGVPAVKAAVRFVGLELGPLGAVVPPGVPQMLGGDALDLSVDAAVSQPDRLAVEILVTMAGGNTYRMPIGGTLEAPEFDESSVLFGVAGRLGGASATWR